MLAGQASHTVLCRQQKHMPHHGFSAIHSVLLLVMSCRTVYCRLSAACGKHSGQAKTALQFTVLLLLVMSCQTVK
jgi:hypothetical protein